ncbi:unnamed protein product [Protopolystoma xenopodis]|uniref:Uncharacterized protein n=1 Tax=Protopolystoma xenopodis TaxID=117903 RepID=A0A3S5A4K6_9PLAT|nr:unnamed protein product [Protopolystoma xenopodis]
MAGSVLGLSCLPGQGADELGLRRLDVLLTTAPRVLTVRCPFSLGRLGRKGLESEAYQKGTMKNWFADFYSYDC